MWPWRHGLRARPDPPPPAPPAAPRGEWRTVAPIQRTVAAHPLVNPADQFRASLETWQDPRFLSPLGHTVSGGEPSGLIDVSTPPTPGSTASSRSWSVPPGVVQRATGPDDVAADPSPGAGTAPKVAAPGERSADVDGPPPRDVATYAIDPPPVAEPGGASSTADAPSALPTLGSGPLHPPTPGAGAPHAVQRTPAVAPSAAAPRRLGLGAPIQPDAAPAPGPTVPPAAVSLPAGGSVAGPPSGAPPLPSMFDQAPYAVGGNDGAADARPAGPAPALARMTRPAGLDLATDHRSGALVQRAAASRPSSDRAPDEDTPVSGGDLPAVRLTSPRSAVLPLPSSSATPPLTVARLVGDRPRLAIDLTTGSGGVPPGTAPTPRGRGSVTVSRAAGPAPARGLASNLHRPAGYTTPAYGSTMEGQAGWPAPVQRATALPIEGGSHRGMPLPAARPPELVTVQPIPAHAGAAPPAPPPTATATADIPARPDPIAVTVQRQPEPETAAAPAASPAAAPAAGSEPEELLARLYDPLLRRLKAELRMDRDRRGSLTDLRL